MLTHGAICCRHFVAGFTIVIIKGCGESKTEVLKRRNFKARERGAAQIPRLRFGLPSNFHPLRDLDRFAKQNSGAETRELKLDPIWISIVALAYVFRCHS